ncbi:MAG: septum formation protein Maf [Lachnospiraceae bacterium]|nr:septum formation protein Maf [Lachnospiraceae bacterium]
MYEVILASGSPRRKEILEQIGVAFRIVTSDKEEVMKDEDPAGLVKDLSRMKAKDVALKIGAESIIIGADTVVAHKAKVLGKPKSREEAIQMIESFQGDSHEVYTGVCIIIKDAEGKEQEINFAKATKVNVCPMTRSQIEEYVDTKEPMDKAGAYAIQGKFAPYIAGIEGDYYNIVGFPISAVYQSLLEIGIDLKNLR